MKKWVIKAIVQKTVSFLPFRTKINYFFQKYITKGVELTDEFFFDRLEHAAAHLKAFSKYTGKLVPDVSLEIGTGWYPIVPVMFYLSGCDKVYSVDIKMHTNKNRIRDTLEKILADEKKICTEYAIGLVDERVRIAAEILNEYERLSTEDILKRLRIEYLIGDARNLSLQDNEVDLVNSNNTFEHVPPDVLVTILKEFKRVVKKGHGVMSHFIDMSDHFAHFDKSITIYNFLRYSDRKWKRIDNRIQPQNRLRIYDYHNMYQELGIPVTEESFRKGKPEELKALMPNEKYLTRPLEETAISHCHFISLMK